MKRFKLVAMVATVLFVAASCGKIKKDEAVAEPVVVQCDDDTDCDDSNPCTTDLCDGDECVHVNACAPEADAQAPVPGPDTVVGQPDTECVSDCAGKQCGDNGCGGECGKCDDNDACTTDFCDNAGQCVHLDACGPDTVQSEPDTTPGVDTEEPPSPDTEPTPGPDTIESEPDTEPACVPDCAGKQCGPDGCGGECGKCASTGACVKSSCENSACVYTPVDCEDGNFCTTDSCDAAEGCKHAAVLCGDKNLCTDDLCDPAIGCVYTAVVCDDSNVCTDDSCDLAVGCVYKDASDCDDSKDMTVDFCHPSAGCQHIFIGECKIDEVCDYGDKCTDDSCNPVTGKCEHKPIDCDDENACTKDSCDAADGCTNSPINCADDDQCTNDSCDPATGECVHDFNSAPCDDGNPCTSEDKCVDGECLDGKSICECEEDADCADFEDGNLCNGTLVCVSNKCVVDVETVVVCAPSPDACAKSVCVTASGECDTEAANSGLVCNDGSACTSGDICWGGACSGTQISCDDGNICTTDSCDPATGCVHAFNTANCNDGSPLTSGDICSLGVCSGMLAVVECDSDTDCQDGKYCNGYEFCVAGQCKPGFLPDCDDGIACTVDTCTEEYYGVNCENTPDDSLCPQGQKCATTWELGGGCVECKGSWDCDDANPCTTDSCDWISTGKCVYTNNTAWCDDAKPCTVNESCVNGACGNGVAKYCNDYNECTVDSCDPTSGCKYSSFTGGGTITCGVGVCTTTASKCVAGVKQTCVAKAPGVEACGNGLDDDCDGAVDEGCATPPPPPTKNVCLRWSDGATNFSDVTMFGCVGAYNAGTKSVDCDGGLGEWKDQSTSSGATATVTWCATVATGKVLSSVVNYKPCLQSTALGYCSFWSPAGNGQVPVSKLDILGKFEYSVNGGTTYVTLANTQDSTAQAYLLDNGQGGANVVVKP